MTILSAAKAWWVGIVSLARNDLHPHPLARAACMLALAGLFALEVLLFGRLRAAGAGWPAQAGLLAGVILAAGWMSWLINRRWRSAFF